MKIDKSYWWIELPIVVAVVVVFSVGGWAQSPLRGGLPPIKTVFIILEENQNWQQINSSTAPYLRNTLLATGAHAEQYYNPPNLHPSEPNYVWLDAGNNLGILDDGDPSINHRNTPDHLAAYLDQAGISWRVYAEDIDGQTCPLTSVAKYAPRHIPFVFFDDVTGSNNPADPYCIAHIRPYTELANDLKNNTVARYNFIVPNLCNIMHDCDITTGDTWLSNQVPTILASQAYNDAGALFITWDEAEFGDGPIGMIVLSPFAKTNYSNSIYYTHSSILKTFQEIFGVGPWLRDAANASDLSDLFIPLSAPISFDDGLRSRPVVTPRDSVP